MSALLIVFDVALKIKKIVISASNQTNNIYSAFSILNPGSATHSYIVLYAYSSFVLFVFVIVNDILFDFGFC